MMPQREVELELEKTMIQPRKTQRVARLGREPEAGEFQLDPDAIQIELRYVAGCPNVDAARALLQACLDELELAADVTEAEGDFPSPTIFVNGTDVMGAQAGTGAFCRLDLPTH